MRFNSNSYTGQTFWLAFANLISFSFGIVSAAVLSRFLSLEEYGSYRQVLYVYSTLLVVFTLGLPRAYSYFLARIPIEEGKSAVRKMNSLFLFLGTIFSLVLFLGSPIIAEILNNPNLVDLLRWFTPTPLFLLPVLGIESVMVTFKKASYATLYVVLSRVFTLICVIIPVLIWEKNAKMAVIGFSIASILCYVVGMWIEHRPFSHVKAKKTSLKWVDLLKYSWPLLMASLWGILYQSSPQFFISRWWGNVTFAEFANGYIELPFATMIIGAVATVLLPALSREAVVETEEGRIEILRLWRSAFEKSAMIIYPLAIFACVFARPIMEILYGSKYSDSAIYFQIIFITNLARVIPFAPVLMALNRLKAYFKVTMFTAVLTIVIDSVYIKFFSEAWGIALIQSLVFLILIVLLLKDIAKSLKIKINVLVPGILIIKLISGGFFVVISAYLIIDCFRSVGVFYDLILSFLVCLILYFPLMVILKVNYKPIFNGFISK